jgi:excisionase family DNA binding protein
MSELITPKTAAELLGVNTNTLRNWELSGRIVAIKTLGGHRRYNIEEIKKIIDANNKKG